MIMGDQDLERIRNTLKKCALLNALKYGGKANSKAVAGKVFSEDPTAKEHAADVFRLADEVVSEINSMSIDSQKAMADSLGLYITKEKVKQPRRLLPPLPNLQKYKRVHVRFAPNPDSVIHLGNTRAAILSDEYAKMYYGLFTLRFEDTSPSIKPPIPEAYDVIKEDLRWLDVHWDNEILQSDRLPIYYEYAKKLLSIGGAYICTCPTESFRTRILERRSCHCRDLPVEEQLHRWEGMLSGKIRKGGAVMRVKTDLSHPNPALRDWPAMRIDTKPHPLQGKKFRVWPLYNFASGIDDHLTGITHILRGKEHEVNRLRQLYMYKHFGWEYPEAIHYGRLKIEGTVLSKSKIRKGIEEGLYKDWSDPRLGTIAALRRRGFLPETIRHLILEVGVKPSEAMISWDNLDSINRKILDPIVKRFVFIADPVPFELTGLDRGLCAKIPLHPDHHEWGSRDYSVEPGKNSVLLQSRDTKALKKGSIFRLMDLFNIKADGPTKGRLLSEDIAEARMLGAPILQWIPSNIGFPLSVTMPDATVVNGVADPAIIEEALPSTFQFYRFGFVRVCREGGGIIGYYTHR
jgi:glutamyl-tRNA synthetase